MDAIEGTHLDTFTIKEKNRFFLKNTTLQPKLESNFKIPIL